MKKMDYFSAMLATLLLTTNVWAIGPDTTCPYGYTKGAVCIPASAGQALGYGSNHARQKGSASSTLNQVIDLSSGLKAMKDPNIHNGFNSYDIVGSSFSEFADKMAAAAGIKGSSGGFSADISASYGTSTTTSSSMYFSNKSTVFHSGRYFITSDINTLSDHLSEDFKKKIKNMSLTPRDARSVIESYGSHVNISALIGATYEMKSHSTANSTMTQADFTGAVNASYDSIFASASVTAGTSTSSSSTKQNSEITTTIATQGGSGVTSAALSTADGDEFREWQKSTGIPENQQFLGPDLPCPQAQDTNAPPNYCDTSEYTVEIWKLIKDKAKSKAVQHAFYALVAESPTVRIFKVTTGQSDLTNEIHGKVSIPSGYVLLSGGVNSRPLNDRYGDPRLPLLKASYPCTNLTCWKARVRYANTTNKLVTGTESTAKPLTVYAMALHDPYGLWQTRVVSTDHIANYGNINPKDDYRMLEYSVAPNTEHHNGYVLVGGGAYVKVKTGYGPLNPFSGPHVYEEGPFLTASYPEAGKDTNKLSWVTGFATNTNVQGNAGDSTASWMRGNGPANYLNTLSAIVKNPLDWKDFTYNGVNGNYTPSYMVSYAIGLRLNPDKVDIKNITLKTLLTADDATSSSSLFPTASAQPPTNCKQTMVAGGGVGKFMKSPFYLTNSYPSIDESTRLPIWITSADNNHNHQYQFWYYHRPHKYTYIWSPAVTHGVQPKSTVTSNVLSISVHDKSEKIAYRCEGGSSSQSVDKHKIHFNMAISPMHATKIRYK